MISLIRRYAIGSTLVSHEDRIRRTVDRLKKNPSVFDEDGRFKDLDKLSKVDKAFQNQLESIVLELNEYLYDDGGRTA